MQMRLNKRSRMKAKVMPKTRTNFSIETSKELKFISSEAVSEAEGPEKDGSVTISTFITSSVISFCHWIALTCINCPSQWFISTPLLVRGLFLDKKTEAHNDQDIVVILTYLFWGSSLAWDRKRGFLVKDAVSFTRFFRRSKLDALLSSPGVPPRSFWESSWGTLSPNQT